MTHDSKKSCFNGLDITHMIKSEKTKKNMSEFACRCLSFSEDGGEPRNCHGLRVCRY